MSLRHPIIAVAITYRWAAIVWLLFAAIAFHQANTTPFPFNDWDEWGHYSYSQELILRDHWWPDFNDFPMVDATTHTFAPTLNYINHPPVFYWFGKILGGIFPAATPLTYRLLSVFFSLLSVVVYLRVISHFSLSAAAKALAYAYPFLMSYAGIAGYFNNDSMALLGGMLCCYGSLWWHQPLHTKKALTYIIIGLLLASVKLTSLLVCGLYVGFIFLHRMPRRGALLLLIATAMLCALPYVILWLEYGSFTPNTPGQLAMMKEVLAATHLADHPAMSPFVFVRTMLLQLCYQFGRPEITGLLLVWLVASLAMLGHRRSAQGDALPILTRSAGLATLIMLIIHLIFAWRRYQQFDWPLDMGLRYYYPLLPIYGLATAYSIDRVLKRITPTHDK